MGNVMTCWPPIAAAAAILLAPLAILPVPAQAQTCLPLLNKMTRPLVKEALKRGRKRVCAKVPQFTQTRSVDLQGLKVCFERGGISISGAVAVSCAAPSGALFAGSIDETLDFDGIFDIRRCRLRDVQVTPRSAMGKVVVSGLDLETRLQQRVNRRLAMFCR
jgi:predicted lipid carrier protein YhbT